MEDESMETTYYEPKVETVIEEIIEETPLDLNNPDAVESIHEAQTIGQEGSTYTNEFTICLLKYRGQTSDPSLENSVIQSSSIDEFIDNLFQLVQPFIKRTIEFPTPETPCWSEKEQPTKEDLPLYVTFKDKIQKRCWRMENLDEHMLMKWASRVLILQVYVYSSNVYSRGMWDTITQVLFAHPDKIVKKVMTKEMDEDEKLQSVVKKLKRIHQAFLVPRTDDAFRLWAQLIVQQPVRRQRKLCFSKPPKKLLENFVIVGKKEMNSNRKVISGPAQRGHSSDGFGFEDEVYALRQTVTQIKDLVEMLDRRVELLEQKCHGFRQTRDGVPVEKGSLDQDNGVDYGEADQNGGGENEEPVMDDDRTLDGGGYSGNPDPLLFNDSVKQEYVESESDD